MMQTLDDKHYRVEEVVSVEKKSVAADMFVLPNGYEKTTGREAMEKIPQQVAP